MNKKADVTNPRWSDVTIAELLFFEKIGSTLSASRCESMARVASRSEINHAHFHNTLKRLEGRTRFSRRLVDRKLVTLTKAGEEVLVYARNVLATYRSRPFQTGRETLRIAATNRILTTLLATYLPRFIESYKEKTGQDIDIEILEANFEQVLSWLDVGEVELAFGGMNLEQQIFALFDAIIAVTFVSYRTRSTDTLKSLSTTILRSYRLFVLVLLSGW